MYKFRVVVVGSCVCVFVCVYAFFCVFIQKSLRKTESVITITITIIRANIIKIKKNYMNYCMKYLHLSRNNVEGRELPACLTV